MSEKTQQNVPITFAQLSKLIIHDLNKNAKTSLNVKYTKEQIIVFLENPMKSQKQLRQLSKYLYVVSPNYKRIIQYFSNLLLFQYIVEPINLDIEKVKKDTFLKQYNKTLNLLDKMNIPHEFTKVLRYGFREDVFYGYEHETKDSYFIQRIDPDLCEISSIEDGVYNYRFDFTYFDTHKELIDKYPPEFKERYNAYLENRKELRWQELDSSKTICFKANEDLEFPLPPFAGVFEAVFDIDDNKRLRRIKNEMDNYMILTQKIPIDEKTGEPNKFLIDMDTAISFHQMAINALPDSVGLVTSPMDIEAIKLERSKSDTDNVAEAMTKFYEDAGVSDVLFNSKTTSVSGVAKSIITDEQIVLVCLQQLERWLNRKLKNENTTYKFRVKFLETTRFNIGDQQERLLKSAQYGMPVKTELAASLGMTPSSFMNMAYLENVVLDLPNTLIPLSSSHTTSGNESTGRPTKNDNDLTESGEKTKNTDANVRE